VSELMKKHHGFSARYVPNSACQPFQSPTQNHPFKHESAWTTWAGAQHRSTQVATYPWGSSAHLPDGASLHCICTPMPYLAASRLLRSKPDGEPQWVRGIAKPSPSSPPAWFY
jgi:hypothetical protein